MLIHGGDAVRPAWAAPPLAVPDGSAGTVSRTEWVPAMVTMAGGLLCAAVGLVIMVAWLVRATAVLRFGTKDPMSFNTALAFAVTGVALVALARKRPGAALAAGLFDAVLGPMVMAEYALRRDLGIDQLVVRAYLTGPHDVPGRIAINTAGCLTIVGAGLLVWAPWCGRARRPAALAAAGSVIGVVAAIAAFGYVTGDPTPYGWSHGTAMAFVDALTMLALAVCLLAAAWHDSPARQPGWPRWLPRRAEAEMAAARESEDRLFQFLNVMPVGVFIAASGGRPYYANDEGERLLGQGVVPGIGTDELARIYQLFQVGTGQVYPTENLPIVHALRGRRSYVDDMEVHGPDGSVIPLEVWGRPVYGAAGEIDYAIAAFADSSERRAREKIMTGQAALLELAHDAIFVRDLDGRITFWNAGAEQAYGFTSAEAVGQISHDLLGTHFPEPLADIEVTTSRHGRWDGELTQRRADGRSIIVESRWAAQRGPDGTLLGFLEINRDITARKDAEREALRRAEEIRALNATLEQRVHQRTVHLERANQNLTAFTYSIAHDLRTPLRALSGFAEALTEEYGGRLDDTGRGYAGRIQAASAHMATVLDDLLRLAQVSRAELNLQDLDLSAEVTAGCDELRARDPGRRVRVTVQDGVRATVDRTLIRTALAELLENAWKFTAGREHATIEFGTTDVDDAPLCCYLRDNGAGFDPAYAGKLFQPFQRLHAVSEYPHTGTGIGLAIVQRIIDRHGGRTWAEGTVGGGTSLYFTLDAKDQL